MAGMFDISLAGPGTTGHRGGRGVRLAARTLVTTAAAAALLSAASLSASADTDIGSTTAEVEVQSSISLNALTADFTLTGLPGATITGLGAATMNVVTNNIGGYSVTVQAEDDELVPANRVANPDEIPIGALSVRETGEDDYTSVSATAATTTHTQSTRSAPTGDAISNDYQVAIPFVNADTYSVTLNYVATTL